MTFAPTKAHTAKETLSAWLRRDGLAIVAYLLATAVMLWPVITGFVGNLMPVGGDTSMKLWDVWWFERLLATGQTFHYTNELFYPNGLDLSFHPASWTVTVAIWLLKPVIGLFSAYKLMILVAVFSSAYAAYLLAHFLTKHRLAAWFAGAIYSFSPYHFADLRGHPDLAQLALAPLAILCLLKSLESRRLWLAALSGVLIGLVAWTGLYLFGFAVITIGLVLAYTAVAEQSWRAPFFWRTVLVLVLASAPLLVPRLLPIFNDRESLSFVIENKFAAYEAQADLLSYVVPPPMNPLLPDFVRQVSARVAESVAVSPSPYLGWVAVTACLSAVVMPQDRKSKLLWLGLALLFFVLSLGPALRFGSRVYASVPLPAMLLVENVQLFRSVRPILFHIGLLLPLAMLAAFGLADWFRKLAAWPARAAAVALALALVLFAEYWTGPFKLSPLEESPVYKQLAEQPGEFALINLPMGYSPSKYYLYLQTLHQRPIVEGMTSRMPPNAFGYMDSNLLLAMWLGEEPLDCTDFSMRTMRASIDALITDGFGYVLVHDAQQFADYFQGVPAWASDQGVSVYALEQLRDNFPCSEN